jgi:hypothetical protein
MDSRIKRLYWQLTALLLAAHFAGWAAALPLAIALTLAQAAHFAGYRRDLLAFEVQLRAAYLGLLLAGILPGCWPLHVIQFVGVNAMLVFDYCLLARLLSLAPWNRGGRLTLALLRRTFLSAPVRGSILDALQSGGA